MNYKSSRHRQRGWIGAVVGAGLSYIGSRERNRSAAQSAQRQMDFQERMSGTAHQREVDDLRAAGLNPLLSVNRGASTPAGAMYEPQNELEAGVHSARAIGETMANVKFRNQQTKQLKEKTRQDAAQATLTEISARAALKAEQGIHGIGDRLTAPDVVDRVLGAGGSGAKQLLEDSRSKAADVFEYLGSLPSRAREAIFGSSAKDQAAQKKSVDRADSRLRKGADYETQGGWKFNTPDFGGHLPPVTAPRSGSYRRRKK